MTTTNEHPLKVWRDGKGLTQTTAAKRFRISQSTWHLLETEGAYASPELALRLSAGTGVPFQRLLRLRDNELGAKKRRQSRRAA